MNTGKLIVIDGIDGSGKATQTKLLVDRLKAAGKAVETFYFPQYEKNFFGRMVRRYLNGEFGPATEVNPYLASILYAADRWESAETLKQWLTEGKTVILDRYYTSNLIHQGSKFNGQNIDDFIAWVEKMEFETFKIPKPDLVIYLHLNHRLAYEMIAKRGNGHDGLDTLEHMQKAEENCLALAKKLKWATVECQSLDNEIKSIPDIAEEVWQKIKLIN
ncbi:MAG: dTMP kinase [Patescibacteria group bacterium]|jgi:dTMP kinase